MIHQASTHPNVFIIFTLAPPWMFWQYRKRKRRDVKNQPMEDWMKVQESYKPKPRKTHGTRLSRNAEAFLTKFILVEQRGGVSDALNEIVERFQRVYEANSEAGLEKS